MQFINLSDELLNIMNLPNIVYTRESLKKRLISKLHKNLLKNNNYYLPVELKTLLNEYSENINMDKLINIIILKCNKNPIEPEYDYYSYDQKPNYNLII